MDKKTITGWSIAVTWSDGKKENILDIPDEVAQYIDDYLKEIEEHGDLAKPSTELVRKLQNYENYFRYYKCKPGPAEVIAGGTADFIPAVETLRPHH